VWRDEAGGRLAISGLACPKTISLGSLDGSVYNQLAHGLLIRFDVDRLITT
jgi:hypothetical protein